MEVDSVAIDPDPKARGNPACPERSQSGPQAPALSVAEGKDLLFGSSAKLYAKSIVSSLANLFLPPACAVCGTLRSEKEIELVCGACWLKALDLPRPRCDRCGHPIDTQRPSKECNWCKLLPAFVRCARSAYAVPGGTAEGIVHSLKYHGWSAVARGMGRRMAALGFPKDVELERSVLVPVPLAASRLRERGYNQSAELAHAISPHWGIPVGYDLVSRCRTTDTQTKLTPGERQRNVFGAFRPVADRSKLRGLHIVLVDDVVTTAATLNACAAALFDGGARILTYVTFGRAPAVGDRW